MDQLEEIWSGEVTVDQRRGLLAMLGRRAGAGLPTVLALRADFFQSALTEPVLRDALDDPVVVGPPRRSSLAEIIVEPARSLGFTVEPSLVTLLLDTVAPADVGSETGSDDRSLLPLLSYVLLMCWERSRRRRITVADYYDSGGVEGAVRDAAETVYQGLDPAGRASCRALFLRLVDVSAGRAVRRRAPAGELTDELVVVATSFARVGLLTLDDDAVTPTHEILFSSWPRLVDWITADREALRVWARVRSDAADWEALAAGAGDGTVLRWPLTLRRGLPTVTARHPVVAVPDPGDEQAKQVEALAWLPDSSTLLVANRTSHVKTLLDAGADGTARRGPELDTGPAAIPLSLTVSEDGRRIAAGTTGRAVHRWALDGRDIAAARPLPELAGWNAYVGDVHYDATGRLAAAGSDERLRVYDPAGTLLVELPASQVATGIHLTSDDHLVSFSVDGLIRNWRLDRLGAASESNSIFQTASSADRTTGVLGVTAAELHHTVVDTTGPVPRETGRVIPDDDTRFSGSVAMSPDGRTVYAGLTDGGIQVFTAPFGPADRSVGSLPVVSGVVVASPLSPDGGTLAVCSDTDPTLALVDVTDPARPEIRASVALPDACVTAEFSADSRQLVVPTLGPETLIVDTSDPDRPTVAHRLTTGIGASPSAGYAHDASLLATSGGDQTIRLWDVNDPVAPTELASFPAPGGEIYWTAFSADDQLLLITSSTGQVTVVDVSDPGEPVPWAVLGATTDPLLYQGRSASPDGGLLAVGVEGAMVMWQLDPEIVMDEACAGGV